MFYDNKKQIIINYGREQSKKLGIFIQKFQWSLSGSFLKLLCLGYAKVISSINKNRGHYQIYIPWKKNNPGKFGNYKQLFTKLKISQTSHKYMVPKLMKTMPYLQMQNKRVLNLTKNQMPKVIRKILVSDDCLMRQNSECWEFLKYAQSFLHEEIAAFQIT